MDARRDVFQAIADPTRREIINLIAHKSLNLNTIADNFNISRPAISQQIKILYECGLIEIRKQGRERYIEARLQPLAEVSDWLEAEAELREGSPGTGRYQADRQPREARSQESGR